MDFIQDFIYYYKHKLELKYFSLDFTNIIYNILYYFVICMIIIYVVYILYFKIKFPFWSKQPVFHFHNLKQWVMPSGVLYKDGKFPINKYYVPFEVNVEKYDTCNENIKQLFFKLIQMHYMTSNDSTYKPSDEKINAYFVGHSNPCFISYINKQRLLYNVKNTYKAFDNETSNETSNETNNNTYIEDDVVCALSSRPVHIYFNSTNSKDKGKDKDTYFNTNEDANNNNNKHSNYMLMNYVDFLCTHKDERKKNYAPKTIYTYAIESQKTQPNTNVFLFKREGSLNAIVPTTTFTTYMYDLKYWKIPLLIKPYELIEINDSNFNIIRKSMDIDNLKCYFSLVGISDLTNIYELIKVGCIKVYCLTIPNTNFVFSLYFFKDNDVIIYENREKSISKTSTQDISGVSKGNVIDCIGSIFFDTIFSKEISITEKKALFEIGFQCCIQDLIKKKYEKLVIENISHNNLFLKNIFLQKECIMKSPTAYFFYNYAHYPFMENDVFFLF